MNRETEEERIGYQTRQALNEAASELGRPVVDRLHQARHKALARQRVAIGQLRMAGIARFWDISLSGKGRSVLAMIAVVVGAGLSYYWHELQLAQEDEEIDSALLTDDLPPSAYLDRGFQAWLDRQRDAHSSRP